MAEENRVCCHWVKWDSSLGEACCQCSEGNATSGDSYYTYGSAIHPTCSTTSCIITTIDRVILVDKELVYIANDDQQGQKTDRGRGRGRRRGRGANGGLHVSPIKPIVKHAHHRRPQGKMKAPSCGTH
ncbi:hypothetical protein CK203_098323 [Vitis vinifera]|uniref:Uncharacterized protein n=1 Tax=Vitis vinifera TaxID=29760 RepID=A0A438D2N0_VITVI|nr:hypothetical protein CK203_098323 [Vitis vinifera]